MAYLTRTGSWLSGLVLPNTACYPRGYCKDQIEALGCRGSSWGTLQLVGELMGTTYEHGAKGAIKGFTCTLD